mgnify:CR=1 FL=1
MRMTPARTSWVRPIAVLLALLTGGALAGCGASASPPPAPDAPAAGRAEDQSRDVGRERIDGLDGRLAVAYGVLEPVALGVVVEQLDDQFLLGHGPAHE